MMIEAGQHHDVDGGVRVEPEDVLIHQDVAVRARIEEVVPIVGRAGRRTAEPAMNGVAITTSSEVMAVAHTNGGIRQNVMPGARIVIVTRKFRAVAIDEHRRTERRW